LVVEENKHHRRIIVPAEWVGSVENEVIILNRWEPDQPGVPAYAEERDDAAIQSDIESRLQADRALAAVQVQVDRGVAHLSGSVSTDSDKAAAEEIARTTPGVIGVRNKLSVDSVIYEQVTAALVADKRTSQIPLEVIVDRGVVTLKGVVPALELKMAAEEIAQRVPGVVTVMNELEVRSEEGETPKAERIVYVPVMRN
jgi:osmotically-inducible protein OsmY